MSKYTPSQAFAKIAKIIDTAVVLQQKADDELKAMRGTVDDIGFDTLIEEHDEWMAQGTATDEQDIEPVNYQSCIALDVADELRELTAINGFTPDYDSVFSQYKIGNKDAHLCLQDWFKLKSQFNQNIVNPLHLLQNALPDTAIKIIAQAVLDAK